MKRTNRILALILALVMALALAACGNGAGTGNTPSTTAPETSAPETTAPETTAPSTGDKDYGDYSAENPLELKLSHFAGNDTNQLAQLAIAFERIVEEKTGGAVDVVIYGGGVLGNDRESFESVIAGTLDMAVNNTPIISNYDEIFQVLDLPYLFQDYDHINAFLASDICQQLLDSPDLHRRAHAVHAGRGLPQHGYVHRPRQDSRRHRRHQDPRHRQPHLPRSV